MPRHDADIEAQVRSTLLETQPSNREQQPNREEWLARLKALMRPWFVEQGLILPDAAVTCGWPSHGGTSKRRRVDGECWHAKTSTRGTPEIFISPALDDPQEVAHVLLHELIHAALPQAGHGSAFKRAALALGLEGPMRSTLASPRLIGKLEPLLAQLGPYPHGRIRLELPGWEKPGPQVPRFCKPSDTKQRTRLLKVACPDPSCGYLVRTTAKWLREKGTPTCPCGTRMRFTGEVEMLG